MSSYKLTDFNTAVDYRLKQSGDGGASDPLPTATIDAIIQTDSTNIYSNHKPFMKTSDVSAGSSYSVTINDTNFPSWLEGFSDIKFIEYPADESQNPNDNEICFDGWQYYEASGVRYVRFLNITPSSGTIRFTYNIKHSIAAAAVDTVFYDNDFAAFCDLAASICSISIASKFGYFTDSTIGADAVEYRTKSDIWRAIGKNFYDSYIRYMFPKISSSFMQKDFDTVYGELSLTRLTHASGTR